MADETDSLLGDEAEEPPVAPPAKVEYTPPPMMAVFTFQSSMNLLFYMMLAMHTVTFDQLMPVLLSYPPQDPALRDAPLKFAGGFGMSSAQVGKIFSVNGMTAMALQVGDARPRDSRRSVIESR